VLGKMGLEERMGKEIHEGESKVREVVVDFYRM
jgi:hypothetical protein